ncbi:MAG: ATP-binding protein [Candidatus Thorarchaeota archaeon]
MHSNHQSETSTIIRIFSSLGKVIKKAVEPSHNLHDPRDQRHARLLSLMLLITIVSILLLIFSDFQSFIVGFITNPIFYADTIGLIIAFFAYICSRSRYYWIGSLCLISYINLMAYFFLAGLSTVVSPDFGYLCITLAILITSIVLPSPRNAVSTIILIFTVLILVEIFILQESFMSLFLKLLGVFMFVVLSTIHSMIIDHDRKEILTQSQAILREKKTIETIIKAVPVGIIVLNPDGSLAFANKSFNDLFYQIFSQKVPDNFNIYDYPDHILIEEIKKVIHSEEPKLDSFEPLKGLHLQINSVNLVTSNQEYFGTIIEFHDITPFIEFEITQKHFVESVSHELRTPITILDMSIKNLKKYWKKLSEERKEEIFNMIIKSSFSLKQIIEDVLIISKIERRECKLKVSPFWLWEILNNIIAQFDSRLRENRITVQIDINPQLEIYGDPQRIGKIFSILLDNAIKFSPDGESTIKIIAIDEYRGEYNPKSADGLLIQVIDSGRGIPEKDLPHVFDRFFRSTKTKDVPGIGIGLFIAKTLVEYHQGHIFVKSMIGKGSTFSVFLPKLKYGFG